MKRVVAVLLALVMVCGAAIADEILFRGHPWGTNYQLVASELGEPFDWYEEKGHLIDWMNQEWDYGKEPNCFRVYGYPDGESFKVAGYNVSFVTFAMLYSAEENVVLKELADTELFGAIYSLVVTDSNAAYEDLKTKLTSLYGEGTEGKEKYSDDVFATWDGDNNTCVKLTLSSYGDVTICYGNTNLEVISELNAALTAEQQAAIKNDLSGL